jgi:hypothetical protein
MYKIHKIPRDKDEVNKREIHTDIKATVSFARMHALFGAALLLAVVSPADSFYLPGVAPTDYGVGNPMNVKVRWGFLFLSRT